MVRDVVVCVWTEALEMKGIQLATETEKRCEEELLTCCASWGYLTPTGPYS